MYCYYDAGTGYIRLFYAMCLLILNFPMNTIANTNSHDILLSSCCVIPFKATSVSYCCIGGLRVNQLGKLQRWMESDLETEGPGLWQESSEGA